MELNGYGDGYGNGYGNGYGYGYGYGDGDGYGYGDGYGEYTMAIIGSFIGARAESLRSSGARLAFWRSDEKGEPANGGKGTKAMIGLVEEIPPPLKICSKHALHATDAPWKWKGKRLWIVALYGEIQQDEDKCGALKREIIQEIPNFCEGV